ncbi:MAG: winged helix-turn-helix domain-containing protein [Myxococcaceae bacterium]
MPAPVQLSASSARRIALAAQGFARPRPAGTPTRRHFRRVLGDIGILQMDSVNVLVRSHYLPAFSRLGAYPCRLLDEAAYQAPRELFEYWGHAASLLPVSLHPLLRWRMERSAADAWPQIRAIQRKKPGFVAEVLSQVTERGPMAASDLEQERPRRAGPWWDWHDGKVALEWLFATGQVTTGGRRNFERVYDLPARVFPASVLASPTPAPEDARRELVRAAARALGVGTERDLRDYFRLKQAQTRPAIAALVDEGALVPARVEGWKTPAYLHRDALAPRRVEARALLSPFDSLVWDRQRTMGLFGFHLRLEIYVPAPKRQFGYYVLPFLLGESLVARVDLKADRAGQTLRVRAAHLEAGHTAAKVAKPLAAELRVLAGWLGLSAVSVHGGGELAAALRSNALQLGISIAPEP